MSVIHIPEEEAIRDFGAVLAKIDAGDDVLIERSNLDVKITVASRNRTGTIAEAIAILKERGSDAVMDEDFARDVRHFRERHPESLDGSKWD